MNITTSPRKTNKDIYSKAYVESLHAQLAYMLECLEARTVRLNEYKRMLTHTCDSEKIALVDMLKEFHKVLRLMEQKKLPLGQALMEISAESRRRFTEMDKIFDPDAWWDRFKEKA